VEAPDQPSGAPRVPDKVQSGAGFFDPNKASPPPPLRKKRSASSA
jgi:hypothetical protein